MVRLMEKGPSHLEKKGQPCKYIATYSGTVFRLDTGSVSVRNGLGNKEEA